MTAAALARAPRATRAGRLVDYLATMFPPWLMVPFGSATCCALLGGLQGLAGGGPLRCGLSDLAGIATYLGFMLLMRIFDELKDAAGDLELARAGDPRYVGRPLVTGRVRLADLELLRWTITIGLLAINLPLGWPWPSLAFGLLFGLAWLSRHWFFWPAVQRQLLLAFATHNPLGLAAGLYLLTIQLGARGGAGLTPGPVAALLVALWLPLAAWEVSRKIRVPAAETIYPTYSRALGTRTAAALPGLLAAVSAALLGWLGLQLALAPVFFVVLGTPAVLLLGRSLLCAVAPTPARTRLQPWAEAYAALAPLAFAVALGWERGVVWTG